MTAHVSDTIKSNSLTSTSATPGTPLQAMIRVHEALRESTGQATEMEVTSGVALDEHRQVDRLSALPNELLDEIFDQAYTLDEPSTGPLSKNLLPFHIAGLYRRVRLRKASKIFQFVRKINREPQLGKMVRIGSIFGALPNLRAIEVPVREEIEEFFSHLTKLEDLDLGYDDLKLFQALPAPSKQNVTALLPRLNSLRVGYSRPSRDFLRRLAAIPNLVSLEISRFSDTSLSIDLPNAATFSNLTTLSIEGNCADRPSVASFCSLFPNLSSLRLDTFYADDFDELLPLLPSTLATLKLHSCDTAMIECDHLLPRFTQLSHLSLDSQLFSADLGTHLTNLVNLESLELGDGRLDIDQFLPLLSGPTRLPLLETLDLDLVESRLGGRLEVDADGSIRGKVPKEERLTAGKWTLPEFDDVEEGAIGGSFTAEKVRELMRVATAQGIEVQGSVVEGLEVVDAYLLEVANVAVYRSYRDKDLRHIAELRAKYPHLSGRLPPLDLDSLDPTKLKLVKTNLPEEGWFSLTLENA